jgi:hypothetical protein
LKNDKQEEEIKYTLPQIEPNRKTCILVELMQINRLLDNNFINTQTETNNFLNIGIGNEIMKSIMIFNSLNKVYNDALRECVNKKASINNVDNVKIVNKENYLLGQKRNFAQ